MKALTRGRRQPHVDQQPHGHSTEQLQSQWTGGSALATRAATVLLWSALLAGPMALALAVLLLLSLSAPAATTAAPPAAPAGEQAAVEDFAQRFVVDWLQTPQGQEKRLAGYVTVPGLTLAEVPSTAEQPSTANVQQVAAGVWTVTVSVNVTPPAAAGSTPTAPVRRYFQVPVHYDAGALVAAALPAPVAAPAAAPAPEPAYRYRANLSHPLATSVGEFLAALLTGAGDVNRYVSPGTTVTAVAPAPYTDVDVTAVLIDRDLPAGQAVPEPGDERQVLVTARASAGAKQDIGVQYALTLAVRAGRWEVKSVDPAPMTATIPGPSPTG